MVAKENGKADILKWLKRKFLWQKVGELYWEEKDKDFEVGLPLYCEAVKQADGSKKNAGRCLVRIYQRQNGRYFAVERHRSFGKIGRGGKTCTRYALGKRRLYMESKCIRYSNNDIQ